MKTPHNSIYIVTSSHEIPQGFNFLIKGVHYPNGNPGRNEPIYVIPIVCRKEYDRVIKSTIRRHGVSVKSAEICFNHFKPIENKV